MKHFLTVFTLLAVLSAKGQDRQRDTVPVIILASDTTNHYKVYGNVKTSKWDTAKYWNAQPFVVKVFSVREKHNQAEGMIDPGACLNCHYQDYWVHLFYLGYDNKPLDKNIVVWQSIDTKTSHP